MTSIGEGIGLSPACSKLLQQITAHIEASDREYWSWEEAELLGHIVQRLTVADIALNQICRLSPMGSERAEMMRRIAKVGLEVAIG